MNRLSKKIREQVSRENLKKGFMGKKRPKRLPYTYILSNRAKILSNRAKSDYYTLKPCKKVLSCLFDTNDFKGCAMFGAEGWNSLKNAVADVAEGVISGRLYVVPTVISCPARGSGDSLADELFGFNDDYAAMLGKNFFEKAWSGIKDFTKNTTHMALSAGSVIPITKPFVTAIRNVNAAGKSLLEQFGIIKKSSSDDETPTGAVTGGGLLILAGVGVGAYFLLKDNKKKKRG